MCVTRQEVGVCRRKCKNIFLPHKNKLTKIMQHIKAKTVKKITTIGTIYCVAVILPE